MLVCWFWCWWRHPNKGDIAHRALNIYATCFPWYTLSFQCYDHPDKLGAWQEFDFSSVCSCQNGIDTLFCLKQTPQSSFADVLNITKKQFLTWWQPLWNFISVGAMVGFLSSLSTKAVSLLIVVNWNNTWRWWWWCSTCCCCYTSPPCQAQSVAEECQLEPGKSNQYDPG